MDSSLVFNVAPGVIIDGIQSIDMYRQDIWESGDNFAQVAKAMYDLSIDLKNPVVQWILRRFVEPTTVVENACVDADAMKHAASNYLRGSKEPLRWIRRRLKWTTRWMDLDEILATFDTTAFLSKMSLVQMGRSNESFSLGQQAPFMCYYMDKFWAHVAKAGMQEIPGGEAVLFRKSERWSYAQYLTLFTLPVQRLDFLQEAIDHQSKLLSHHNGNEHAKNLFVTDVIYKSGVHDKKAVQKKLDGIIDEEEFEVAWKTAKRRMYRSTAFQKQETRGKRHHPEEVFA
jgi:hypothetical protein